MLLSQARAALRETDRNTLETLIDRFGEELVTEYREQGYSLDDMEEAYQGAYSSDEDFVQELLDETGGIPKDFPSYITIDWESTARDIMMDYFEINGHYFRSF